MIVVLHYLFIISCRGQSIVTGIGGTLESYYIDSPVLHQEAYLQKICALEKNQAAKKLIVSSCPPTTSALLLYHYYTTAVWPVRTANNAAIRTYTLLLFKEKSERTLDLLSTGGEEMSKRLRGIRGCKYKTSSWHLNGFPMTVTLGQQYNIGEKPTVILYTYINRHAGTPEKQRRRKSTSSNMVVITYCYIGCDDKVTTMKREQRGP